VNYHKPAFFLIIILGSLSIIGPGCAVGNDSGGGGYAQLDEVYADFFPVGAAVSAGEYGWSSFTVYPESVLAVFNSYVAENCMKPGLIQPSEGNFNWNAPDIIATQAAATDVLFRGHVLVWHSQTPSWMTSGTKEQARTRMQNHITAVVGRYKDSIYCWDVVNEAVSDSGGYRTSSPWYIVYGDATYIQDAFDFAYAADPDCKLFYNDYSVVNSTKRDAIVTMITDLRLIEDHHMSGIGLQAHWKLTWPSVSDIQDTIDTFADMGLEVQITELDIDIYENGSVPETEYTEELENQLADRYEELFQLFRDNADKITGVTLWGVADDRTWLNHFWDGVYHSDQFRQNYPLLFDINHQFKKAYVVITDY
jgi:endo-1,4-beta-xylanase